MKFSDFESLFLSKYPDGSVVMHSKCGGTERNGKVGVAFNGRSRLYEYYGSYEDILCRVGIPTISKRRLHELELTLTHYRENHGKNYSLFENKPMNFSREIAELEAQLKDIRENYTIV